MPSVAESKQTYSGELAGTAPLLELIHTCLLSAYVPDTVPISLLLVSESGAGKSKSLLKFTGENLLRCDDLSSKGLMDIMGNDKANDITFLVIPDFNPVLSHKPSVTQLLIANLLTLMSDGTVRISDGRVNKELIHKPIGIISAVTSQMFFKSQRRFHDLGIMRRFIPIYYQYSLSTIRQAQTRIRIGAVNGLQLQPLQINQPIDCTVSINETNSHHIETMSSYLSMNLAQLMSYEYKKGQRNPVVRQGPAMYPMSPQVILQTLARAHALYRKDIVVREEDLSFLEMFIRFTSLQNRVEL